MTNWDEILRLLFQVPYGQRDPVLDQDIGFYLFSLPAYVALKNWMMLALVLSTLVAGAVYWVRGDIELDHQQRAISWAAVAHGSALLGLFFAVKTWSYALERYSLLYDDNGVLVGASYTDVTVIVPILWLMIALSVIGSRCIMGEPLAPQLHPSGCFSWPWYLGARLCSPGCSLSYFSGSSSIRTSWSWKSHTSSGASR